MALANLPGRFEAAVTAAIQAEVASIAEEEISAAEKRVAERVRQRVASIAISLCSEVRFERMGSELQISIRDPHNRSLGDR